VNSFRNRSTSASSVFRQNCQYSYGDTRSALSHTAPLRRLAHLGAGRRRDQRRGQRVELRQPHAPAEVDAVDDVAPLVGAAHLQRAAVAAGELDEVVGLQDHVVELEEGQLVLALEPELDRVHRQHAIDREVAADLAQEVDVVERRQPFGIVGHQAAGRCVAEVEKARERPAAGFACWRRSPRR
jgi:hypothetical protein